MPRLEFEIAGNNSGLAAAANQSIGILESLQNVADGLKIDLFKATTVGDINNIGAALTRVTGNIKDYINTAVKGSQAWQDQTAQTALDQLSTKLLALNGNAQLFGTTIKTQQAEINAYQAAITRLLSAGIDPLDTRIQSLKSNIDALTASITQQNAAAAQSKFASQFQDTGALIADAQRKVDRLGVALQNATSTRDIALYNQRLIEAQGNLDRLRTIGLTASQASQTLAGQGGRIQQTFSSIGVEFSRIIQDAPYAFKALGAGQNNFGAIGNNITRVLELYPNYIAQVRAAIIAQGGQATSANVLSGALKGLFSGFGGVIFLVSAAVSAFTAYQAIQQKNAREAENHASALQKQKKALDDYILSLTASQQASAKAATSYGEEVSKLDFLFAAVKQNTSARYENGTALQELQRLYPDVFGNLKQNQELTDRVTISYQKLRQAIIDTATVQAANKLAGSALEDNIRSTVALAGATDTANKEYQKYLDLQQKLADLRKKQPTQANAGGQIDIQISATTALLNDQFKAVQQAIDVQKHYQDQTKSSATEVTNYYDAARKAQENLNKNQPKKSGILYDLEQQLKRLQDIRPTIKVQAELDLNTKEIKKVQDQIDKLGGAKGTRKEKAAPASDQLSLGDSLRNIAQRSDSTSAITSLSGTFEEQKAKIERSYADLFGDLASLQQKITADNKISVEQRTADTLQATNLGYKLEGDKIAALAQLSTLTAQNTANEIQRINDQAGVKSSQSRTKELAEIDARYNAEIDKAKGNQAILDTISKDREIEIQRVNDKYAKLSDDLYAKIGTLEDTALAATKGKNESETQRIKNEWEKRKKQAADYYDALRKLQDENSDPFGVLPSGVAKGISGLAGTPAIDKAQKQTNDILDKGQNAAIAADLNKEITQGLTRGVRSFSNNFYNTLTSINQQADQSFGAIFSTLSSELNKSLNDIFLNVVSSGLEKALKKGIEDGTSGLSKELTGTLAIAGLAGGLISGITPKTSAIGQTTGGFITGAAGGALAGSVIPGVGTVLGGAIGGLVGGIGGLFGSKKARKEAEKLQQQQLEEAKKQTELLRQQALAYTSSIIGKQTTNGIITGVDINAFGELTAKVSGKDLQFVLDRNAQSR